MNSVLSIVIHFWDKEITNQRPDLLTMEKKIGRASFITTKYTFKGYFQKGLVNAKSEQSKYKTLLRFLS